MKGQDNLWMIQRFILRSSSFPPPHGDLSFVIPSLHLGPSLPHPPHPELEIQNQTLPEGVAAWQRGQPLSP